ncbi:putative disease resistance RPP13-like protein 1 [Oryza glaberrima]|uniref:putative disease resistance RPP13-like protein 1 n=1 Tax=Oryza glaberrima TaxID=4538 RepID=UPI00224C3262|nr:putative disease resistance RPP13-like protein 1 [Oryza glaberrima]
MAALAGVGWALSIAGWIASPTTTRLLREGYSLLGFDESEKLRDMETRILPQLASMLKQVERVPPGQRACLEDWSKRLRSAFYDAEDILDVADYHRLEKQIYRVMLGSVEAEFPPNAHSLRLNTRCYSTVGIYGVGGSGKTTLAQYVCDYERMKGYFSPIMWIHVSQSFSVHRIYQEMLESATVNSPHQHSNLDTLQLKLKEELRGKRFLLVLDDIWAEKDVSVIRDEKHASVWYKLDQLLCPLKDGMRGSKVLVTTRFKDVAMSLGAQSVVPIPDLNEEDFFSLLMHYALDGVSLDNQKLETFHMIGRDIVKKLKGSPLAARLVGARLRRQLDANFWRRVEHQDLLAGTLDALWWSYQLLDEHVRRCFAYCSMFSHGYIFERGELVDLWMAEGFLKPTNADEQMEDVGQNYFDELVSCSFLQTRRDLDGSDIGYFTIHDLLHELAGMIAGDDCFTVVEGEMKEIPPDVRYLFINLDDPMKVIEPICKLKKLRTLKFRNVFSDPRITVEALEGILKKLKKLRVVQVHIDGDVLMLPACICDLKHLRCLSICSSKSRKVTLPRKFGRLYHLQILDNRFSDALEFTGVESMSNLISLRHIRGGKDSGFPGVQKLKSLRELSNFMVRKEKGYELKQLEGLNQLGGDLTINGLDSVESKERSVEAKLTDKKHLKALSLVWSNPEEQMCSPEIQLEVIDGLCPPSQLRKLEIRRYDGWNYPSWMSQSQNCLIRSLKCLTLSGCHNLEALPELGELFIHLLKFTLVDLPNLKLLPRLPDSLESLYMVSLPKIKLLPRLPDGLKSLDIIWCWALVVTCTEDVEMIRSMFTERASQIDPSLNITRPDEISQFADNQYDKFMTILCDIVGTRNREMVPNIVPFIRGQMEEGDYPQMILPASLCYLMVTGCAMTNIALQNCLRGCTSLLSLTLNEIPFLKAIPSEVTKHLRGLLMLQIGY